MSSHTLVIQLARFGDLLQTKRLVKSLQESSVVHLAVDRSLAELAEIIYPGVEVHALEAHFSASTQDKDAFSRNLKVIGEIAENKFDLVVNLNFSGLNFALVRLFDPSRVRGYINHNGQETRHSWTRLYFRLTSHRKLSALNLMDFWGLFAPDPLSPDRVNPAASDQGQGLGVVLAGRDPRRSIPASTLAGMTGIFRNRVNSSRIVLLGGKAEIPLAREFMGLAGKDQAKEIEDLTGKTALKDLPDVLASLEMVLTPDTGTMHLAAHMGTRIMAFFISSALCFETGPYGLGHRIFQAMPGCAPCIESRPCKFDLICHEILKSRSTFKALWKDLDIAGEDAAVFDSFLDDLGVNYRPGQGLDKFAGKRKALRELIRRYLGYNPIKTDIPQEISKIFFHEQQWMLDNP
ncbi:MAG: glycosyltransferase family 9 protein [Desulfonatronovibrio sp.]